MQVVPWKAVQGVSDREAGGTVMRVIYPDKISAAI
jgi:hypothetical protein